MSESRNEQPHDGPLPGSVIAGKYEVLRTLGCGGMGVVCAARNIHTDEQVALKFIKGDAEDPELGKRLVREARAASAVKHPNVVEVREVLELERGTPMIVMELLKGESLRDYLKREGPLTPREAAQFLLPVASAVGTAHVRGIVHRDLKPDNIFLSEDSAGHYVVKVLDFGIAKVTRINGETNQSLGLTATGEVLGTPSYMSPEQIFGEGDIDQRADVWSMGIILYECLSGVLPTQASNVGQVLKMVVTGGIKPLSSVMPGAPSDLAELVGRMLTRDRDERPQDLRDVVQILSRYCDSAAPAFSTARVLSAPRDPNKRPVQQLILGWQDVSATDVTLGTPGSFAPGSPEAAGDGTFRQLASARSVPYSKHRRRQLTALLAAIAMVAGAALMSGWWATRNAELAQSDELSRQGQAGSPAPPATPTVAEATVQPLQPAPTASALAPSAAASEAPHVERKAKQKPVRSAVKARAVEAPPPPEAAATSSAAQHVLPIFEKPPF